MMRCNKGLRWATCLFALTFALPAQANDAKARRALKLAMEKDYLETRFDKAEKKLRDAIKNCKKTKCSDETMAELNIALGSVLAGGKKELQDARDAFVEALTIDPTAEPDPDLTSAEVTFAFNEAKKKLHLDEEEDKTPKKKKKKKKKKKVEEEDDETDDTGEDDEEQTCEDDSECKKGMSCQKGTCVAEKKKEEPLEEAKRNWVTLSFSPDISLVSSEDTCSKQGQAEQHFVCARSDGTRYRGTPTPGVANNVNTGLALSTIRLALGFDRLFGDHVMLGLRLGFAFNGTSDAGASFLPIHAEGRLTYWPGNKSLAQSGVSPFLFASAGMAQVDSQVEVEVLEDGVACGATDPNNTQSPCTIESSDGHIEDRRQTLAAYKQAGLGFASFGLGLRFAPSARAALNLGVRTSVTFPVVTAVFSPEAGLTLGF